MSDELSVEADGRDRRRGEVGGDAGARAARARSRPGGGALSGRHGGRAWPARGRDTPARVIATAPAPPPVARAEPRTETQCRRPSRRSPRGSCCACSTRSGVSAEVRVEERADEVVALVRRPDAGVLIGRHGQMLDAVQLLANAIAHRAVGEDRRRIVIDAAGYRDRRTAALESSRGRRAERVAATGQPSMLDPMSAVERRIVHEALKDDPEVETASEGTEPYRCVVVLPRPTVGVTPEAHRAPRAWLAALSRRPG